MDFSLIIPAFIAGVLTFLAPCTFPLIPGYLGFISGASFDDLKDPEKSKKARWKIFLNGVFFIAGFSAVFIGLGTLAGFVGGITLGWHRLWLGRIGGIFVIIFGLFMLYPVRNPFRLWRGSSRLKWLISNGVNVLKIPFFTREKQFKAPALFKRGKPTNSFILGSAFGFGWTPCVGPILGSILLLASTSATTFQGALLLSVFSAGLAVPFLLIAIGIGSASKYIARISRYLYWISIIGGIFLVFIGILLITGKISFLIQYSFIILRFINYKRILDYL